MNPSKARISLNPQIGYIDVPMLPGDILPVFRYFKKLLSFVRVLQSGQKISPIVSGTTGLFKNLTFSDHLPHYRPRQDNKKEPNFRHILNYKC